MSVVPQAEIASGYLKYPLWWVFGLDLSCHRLRRYLWKGPVSLPALVKLTKHPQYTQRQSTTLHLR